MIAFKRIRNEYTDARLTECGFRVVYYDEISYNIDGSPRDLGIANDPMWYFRAVGNAHAHVNKLIAWGRRNGKVMFDDYLLTDGPGGRGKFRHYEILRDTIRMPHTTRHVSINMAESAMSEYPVILKFDQYGRQGMGTFLLECEDDINTVKDIIDARIDDDAGYTGLGTDWLVQEYIPNEGDYRAMVVGDRCIGMYKRRPKKQRIVQSSSAGTPRRFKGNRFPSDVADVAIRGAMALGITVCGVDLVRDTRTGEPVAIEFNEAPAFGVFEKRVHVSVPDAIAEELGRRHAIPGR